MNIVEITDMHAVHAWYRDEVCEQENACGWVRLPASARVPGLLRNQQTAEIIGIN